MALTTAEKRKQLEALLRARILTQAEFDARVKALEAQAVTAPPLTQNSLRADDRRSPLTTRKSPDAFFKAPYRFVPYDKDMLLFAEPEALAPIDAPKVNGLCAEIVVRWKAEGPLLMGKENEGLVTPMRWSDGGFFIPGATLRGAIRSVCEIIGGGRLAKAHVNLEQAFALRDFTHKAYSNSAEDVAIDAKFPLADLSKVKAGWLKLAPGKAPSAKGVDDAMLKADFEIEPAKAWYRVEAAEIWSAERPQGRARDAMEFTKLSMIDKYAALGLTRRSGGEVAPATYASKRKFQHVGGGGNSAVAGGENLVRPDKAGTIEGCYAFSGKSPSGKRYEYVIDACPDGGSRSIKAELWERFVRSHSQAVKNKLKPDGAWKDIPAMFRADPDLRLPVFYVGDLDDQQPESFAFGVTRLFKAPHTRTLKQVLKESGVSDPVDLEGGAPKVLLKELDMIDALFGYVYEDEASKTGQAKTAPRDVARKGRVAFSPAELVVGNAQVSETIETVMMGPRPSFAPFYLKGNYKDYSAPDGEALTIAGRKRYPVRQPPEVGAQAAFQSVRTRLKDQIEAIKRMNPRGEGPKPDVVTRLQFLLPAAQSGALVFESRIRLFNVTPVELGLVIDAVTLGGKDGLRHAIGRAKPFGAGQMQAEIRKLAVERNIEIGVVNEDGKQAEARMADWTDYREKAFAGRGEAARAYAEMRQVFEACCDPAIGARLDRDKLLDYLRLREQPAGANRPENPYQRLRDWVKPMKNAGMPTAGKGPLLKIG